MKSTRRSIILAALSGLCLTRLAYAAPLNISHISKIKPVDQGNANLCWLACAAMLQSWKGGGAAVTMENLASQLGGNYSSLLDAGLKDPSKGGLDGKLLPDVAKKLNMKTEGLKSMTSEWWISRLTAGPIWVGGYPGSGSMAHAVVLAGIHGQSDSLLKCKIDYVDPNGAQTRTDTFESLIKFYEGLARSGVDQLMYYP